MKKLFIPMLLAFLQVCFAQQPGEKFEYKELGWTIMLPEDYEIVDDAESKEMEESGLDMFEESLGQDLDSIAVETTTLFMLKQGDFNTFEANIQLFDPAVDGDFEEVNEELSAIILQTFEDQMPGIKIDSSISSEMIGGRKFLLDKFTMHLPGDMLYHLYMYTGLIGNKNLTINITYMEEESGKILLDALKNSTFK
jgi:hypothetical protein